MKAEYIRYYEFNEYALLFLCLYIFSHLFKCGFFKS